MRWRWQANGSAIDAVRAVDTVTHPDWRGKGLFTVLTRTLVDTLAHESFVFNTPNQNSLPGYLKLGWRTVRTVPVWVKPLRPGRVCQAAFKSPAPPPPVEDDCFDSAEALLGDAALPEFLDELHQREHRYHTRRTPTYLQWRYALAPGLSYKAAWQFGSGHGAALIFRTRSRSDLAELLLSEVLVASTWRAVRTAAKLIRRVAADCNCDYLVASAAARTPESLALMLAGFVPVPGAGPTLVARRLNTTAPAHDVWRWRNWRLSAGDLELF